MFSSLPYDKKYHDVACGHRKFISFIENVKLTSAYLIFSLYAI